MWEIPMQKLQIIKAAMYSVHNNIRLVKLKLKVLITQGHFEKFCFDQEFEKVVDTQKVITFSLNIWLKYLSLFGYSYLLV